MCAGLNRVQETTFGIAKCDQSQKFIISPFMPQSQVHSEIKTESLFTLVISKCQLLPDFFNNVLKRDSLVQTKYVGHEDCMCSLKRQSDKNYRP